MRVNDERESIEFNSVTSNMEIASANELESVALATDQDGDTSIDWLVDSTWPLSNAWQWTYEDLYLQASTNTSGLEGNGPTSALLCELGNSGRPLDTLSTALLNVTEPVTPVSRSPQPVEAECLLRCEDGDVAGGAPSRKDLEAMATHLIDLAASPNAYSNRVDLEWDTLDTRLQFMIAIETVHGKDSLGCLDKLVQRYFFHFHPLWPLIVDTSIDLTRLHPLLYLTLASIGALYHSSIKARQFGSLLHSQLREVLIHRHIIREQTAMEALDIGRAILLTQVAALYFEQEKAFSAAQQLGTKLNSQAYRMRLFNQTNQRVPTEWRPSREADVIMTESRLMLAFGTLRAEAFISIFFNRKPLLSYEEVNLPLPHGGFSENTLSGHHLPALLDQKMQSPCAGMLFSDLVRVALDEEESLPVMKPTELELLLFGLQNDVWRFSHDPGIFKRLLGQRRHDASSDFRSDESPPTSADLLDQTSRKMHHLIRDYDAIVAALHRWKRALSLSQLSYPAVQDRSAYLSGLILYELSFLRLSAPIESILQLVYRPDNVSERDLVTDEVLEWTASDKARDSVAHAESIYRLLMAETARPLSNQAKYNILTLIAVHHAAAVIWAVIGAGHHPSTCFSLGAQEDLDPSASLKLVPVNAASIISHFADLYPKITASRGVQSSFHKIVKRLTQLTFPLTSPTDLAE